VENFRKKKKKKSTRGLVWAELRKQDGGGIGGVGQLKAWVHIDETTHGRPVPSRHVKGEANGQNGANALPSESNKGMIAKTWEQKKSSERYSETKKTREKKRGRKKRSGPLKTLC